MADLNIVALVGRLTRDTELKYTNSGFSIANLSLAVNRNTKKGDTWQEEVSFFDAVLLGKRAEALAQYLVKGKQIGIQGELRQRRWEQEGQTRSRVEIVINDIQLLGARGSPAAQGSAPRPGSAPAATEEPAPTEDFEDDIPF